MSFLRGSADPSNIIQGIFPAVLEGVKTRMAGERPFSGETERRRSKKGVVKTGRPEGMPSSDRKPKGTKYVTMRDPETGYKYGGRVVDGVPQFTKPDFSDRKPLSGYPKKDTDRPTSGRGGRRGGGRGGRRPLPPRDPNKEYPTRKTPKDQRPVIDPGYERDTTGKMVDSRPPRPEGGRGGRRSDPRPDRDRNRGREGGRGRKRVRDEAFERRRKSGNKRSMTRRERRRRVRNANNPRIK
tara:strand:+ start:134 stop:853 length:720 start_codon:yes stop_codon:yes gene_type:complete